MTSGKARREKGETGGGEGRGGRGKTSQIFVARSFVWSKGLGREQNILADSVLSIGSYSLLLSIFVLEYYVLARPKHLEKN